LQAASEESFYTQLAVLRSADYCITDIYHMAINALREGVPVLLYSRMNGGRGTLGDGKKLIMMQGYGLSEYVLDVDEIISAKNPKVKAALVEEAAEKVSSDRYRTFLNETFPLHIERWKGDLLNRLNAG
jgi:hypothetical protein